MDSQSYQSGAVGGITDEELEMALKTLSVEVRELSLGSSGEVERVTGPLAPLQFLRNYVMPGRPCIITNAIDHWAALHRWSNDYLCSVLRDQTVSMHFTPDGRADAVANPSLLQQKEDGKCTFPSWDATEEGVPAGWFGEPHGSHHESDESVPSGLSCVHKEDGDDGGATTCSLYSEDATSQLVFVTAHVEQLPFPDALQLITQDSADTGKGVAYAQQQNGCFLSEYSALSKDAEEHLPWATEALGSVPEAVNLWIGNEKAVTSFHKDHYENMYAVVAGEKHFTLLPPTDVHRLYVDSYPAAQYVRAKDGTKFLLGLDLEVPEVPWASVDPYPPASQMSQARAQFSRYFDGPSPFRCTVKAGEILYLPSMWFHHVRQSTDDEGRTIAINYWYDMDFDVKYAYFNLVNSLSEKILKTI